MSEIPTKAQKDCVFCPGNLEEDRIIRIGELCTSIISSPWMTPGYSLVVPNRHIIEPDELTEEEALAFYREQKRIRRISIDNIANGFDIWQKHQPMVAECTAGTVKVTHLHFHGIPRSKDDGLFRSPDAQAMDIFWRPPINEIARYVLMFKEDSIY